MYSFRRFDRSTFLLISLLVISFLLATFDVRAEGAGIGTTMREGAQTLFSPLQRAMSAATRPVVAFIDGISNIAGLRDENERLRDQVAKLDAQIRDQALLETRVAELEKLNGLEAPGELAAVSARIASPGSSDFDQIRWIEKGTSAGISVGDAVFDDRGLVGRIDVAFEDSARVRLLTDPNFGVGVRDTSTNETGIVEGKITELSLKMFQAETPVEEGDLVVTSGSRFPPGIPVGTVSETAVNEAGFALVTTVDPLVEVSKLDYVKVIVGWSPLDAGAGGEVPIETDPNLPGFNP